MKLRITISGPKVHDVGYRNFLMTQAIAGRIKMFEAYSIEGEQVQQVMILIDGGDKEVDAFKRLAEIKRPAYAVVSKVVTEYYDGEVMRVGEYARIFAASQLSKAIPILSEMKEDIKSIKEDVEELKWGVKEVIGEVKEMNAYVKNLTGM
jgi:acylphosphatase